MSKYAFLKAKDVLEEFGSSPDGLSVEQVLINSKKFGFNSFTTQKKKTYLSIFLSQFNNLFNYILIVSAIIVFLLGDSLDFYVILFVVVTNVLIGFVQEGKSYKIFEVLNKSIKSEAMVVRQGKRMKIDDEQLTVGDIILLKDGEKIPADARLIESNNLKINESSLTGESTVVLKQESELKNKQLPISDQINMVFRGSYVISGLAKAVVVAVGDNTNIGEIVQKVLEIDSDLPVKKSIKNLSKVIFIFVVFFSLVTFIFGIGYGFDAKDLFLMIVALFVAAIPQSLPVVLTVILANGFHRMSKRKVLVKKLQAVDALGQTKIVALDKTGTITKNQMKIEKIYTDNNFYYVSGDGYEPVGKILFEENVVDIYEKPELHTIAKISVATAIGSFSFNPQNNQWESNYGDPTEVALLVFAEKMGLKKEDFLANNPLEIEIPFDMNYKHHSAVHKIGNELCLFVAGAPENVLDFSSKILLNGIEEKINDVEREKIQNAISKATKDGYRILSMAYKKNPEKKLNPESLKDLVYVGFVCINDTIRKGVEDSIKALEDAGMKAVMITGDHKDTAIGIAKKIGLFKINSKAITGKEMNQMTDIQIKNILSEVAVFSRVTPEQKLKIISLFKERGETIAMTGDGVNDVLSLVKADLGVSMGAGATAVAMEAADIILLDNNFGNLSFGVLEGRNIYLNLRKTTEFLLSTNIAELFVVMLSVILGLPAALSAIQILWINLVTDSFLVFGFAFEPTDKKLASVKDWKPAKNLLNKKSFYKIFLLALVMTLVTFSFYLNNFEIDLVKASTMVIVSMTILQIYNVFNIKSDDKSIFKTPIFNNWYLLGGTFFTIGILIFTMYNSFLQKILNISPISFGDWAYVLIICLVVVVVEEIRKLFFK
jgi:P-type Ca2+ transporter type 2C